MKIKILAFITIAAMSVIGTANAGQVAAYFSAGQILSDCESENVIERDFCVRYLAGISDVQGTLYNWNELTRNIFCAPLGVTANQLRKIYIKYANDNPEDLHQDAGSMALNAFIKAFPCE